MSSSADSIENNPEQIATEAASQTPDTANQPAKNKGRARKALRWVLAVEAWKKQFGHLKHRASFPLLRRVISIERQQATNFIQLAEIPTHVLERSQIGHIFILVVLTPTTLWAAYTLVKGVSAAVRFDVVFNEWLFQGIPLFIFAGMKCLTSNKTRKLFAAELEARARKRKEQ